MKIEGNHRIGFQKLGDKSPVTPDWCTTATKEADNSFIILFTDCINCEIAAGEWMNE